MNHPQLYRGGQVVTPGGVQIADIFVENGVIAAISAGRNELPDETEVFGCEGKVILPGLFDMHVHLREPGQEDKETIATGTQAALNGGITGILAMPNTTPPIDSGAMVRHVLQIAREQGAIDVWTTGCITKGRAGLGLAEMGDMVESGAVAVTDDGDPVRDPQLFRRALEYAASFDLLVACHCETPELSQGGAMHEGLCSYRLGVPGIPAISEEISIERDLRIAQMAGARLHIQHVTTARGAEIIRRFKEQGVAVSAEVCPHHLLFTDDDVGDYDSNFKMNPPLRRPEDKEALLAALREGVIDVIATDHAPHTVAEKNGGFAPAPFGITGLETALPSLYHHFIECERLSWERVVEAFALAPRRLLGLETPEIVEGKEAHFVVFDPRVETHFTRAFFCSKSINTPFLNQKLKGAVEKVVVGEKLKLDREKT